MLPTRLYFYMQFFQIYSRHNPQFPKLRSIAFNRPHVAAMKLAVVCLFAVISIVYVYADTPYTTKFDNIDVDQILHNDRLLKRYINCVLDKPNIRCPAEALELKKYINDALETECEKCSDRQKEMAKKVIKFLVINKKDMWNELKAKYDSEGKFAKKYEDMAKEEGVQI